MERTAYKLFHSVGNPSKYSSNVVRPSAEFNPQIACIGFRTIGVENVYSSNLTMPPNIQYLDYLSHVLQRNCFNFDI